MIFLVLVRKSFAPPPLDNCKCKETSSMLESLSIDQIRTLLPVRPETAHKGTFGHLVVLAGSPGFTGAVKLACNAACRSGVGLVTAAIPRTLSPVIAASLVEPMTFGLEATDANTVAFECLDALQDLLNGKSALVAGPGLSTHPSTARLMRHLYRIDALPMVVDADGLNALSTYPERLAPRSGATRRHGVVFTPHPGEMSRLTGLDTATIQQHREETAARYAALWQVTVVLKGHGSLVAAPDGRITRCPTGNQGMATGGTGDVLAGILGALIAQGMNTYDAACVGVYVHGLAGDIAAHEKTARAMIAGDLIDALPQAWNQLERIDL